MVIKKHIVANLEKLENEYVSALRLADPDWSVYYSKLATIEYCGWLEETLDDIVVSFAGKRLRTACFRDLLKSKVDGTHGFLYRKHFRPMLVHVVGVVRCEGLQSVLDKSGDLVTLESELDTYATHRNNAAHTHIRNVGSYPSPSATLVSLQKVYPILKRVYAMRKVAKYC